MYEKLPKISDSQKKASIIVIGGGPAGAMAAIAAAQEGCSVQLCERNDRLFRKLRITGKGRCNITNAQQPETFINNIVRNSQFLRSSFSRYNNEDLMRFMQQAGLDIKVERGQRVFPVSDNAHDVVAALERQLLLNKVDIIYNARVNAINVHDGKVCGVKLTNGHELPCNACILATGGSSYPRTGSTGDGYRLARMLGHSVTKLYPSLAPIMTAEKWVGRLQGLSLKNVELHAYVGGKKVYSERGEMLFTDCGISGPMVLSASAHLDMERLDDSRIIIDLKPALTEEKLDERMLRDFALNSNRQLKNSLNALLPKSLIPVVISLSGVDGDKQCNAITRAERKVLVQTLKRMELYPAQVGPMDVAIITRGGVDVKEIDPRTMGSKLVQGLYFAGELMDLDAYTGGYNLQIAFTTGYAAGKGSTYTDNT